MQIADTKLCPFNMHRQEHLRTPREILDIAIPAVLRAAGDCPRALVADFFLQRRVRRASVHVFRLRRFGDDARVRVRAGFYELAFALVPGCEDFGRGRAAQDARMNEPGEADAGDVA